MKRLISAAIIAATLGSVGCVTAVAVRPRAGLVLVDGRWVVPPRAGAVWIAPHWERRAYGRAWVSGYWVY
jgi:hypothetical protein